MNTTTLAAASDNIMNIQCIKETNHLLTYDTTWVAGYKCTSMYLYFSVLGVAVLLQIARNFVWTKTSQATREALHEPIEGEGCFGACCSCGSSRMAYIRQLLFYTVISMCLYIVNILLILGANLGILGSVLLGNVLGTWLSVSLQKQDKARTATTLKTMIDEYYELRAKNMITMEEKKHLERLEEMKFLLRNFINGQSRLVNKGM
jgi:hypothetical protein